LSQRFDGRLDLILAAYNAGETVVEAFLTGRIISAESKVINPTGRKTAGIPPYRETQADVRTVISLLSSIAKNKKARVVQEAQPSLQAGRKSVIHTTDQGRESSGPANSTRRSIIARIRTLPGVRSASATEFLPLYETGFVGGPFGVDGRRANRSSTMVPTLADYFQTMGGRILEGREFTNAEVAAGSRVAVVNERFAGSFGGPREILGRQLTTGLGNSWTINKSISEYAGRWASIAPAPPRGSFAPKTTQPTPCRSSAPIHMTHGSKVL
jgi:hypothetical protein